jgi:hypothetical protein
MFPNNHHKPSSSQLLQPLTLKPAHKTKIRHHTSKPITVSIPKTDSHQSIEFDSSDMSGTFSHEGLNNKSLYNTRLNELEKLFIGPKEQTPESKYSFALELISELALINPSLQLLFDRMQLAIKESFGELIAERINLLEKINEYKENMKKIGISYQKLTEEVFTKLKQVKELKQVKRELEKEKVKYLRIIDVKQQEIEGYKEKIALFQKESVCVENEPDKGIVSKSEENALKQAKIFEDLDLSSICCDSEISYLQDSARDLALSINRISYS